MTEQSVLELIYYSNSTVSAGDERDVVSDIVAVSTHRNRQLAIAGVLVLADGLFAQLLEGWESEVRALMERICADSRHQSIDVIHEERRKTRRYLQWGLAYAGSSRYIARHIVGAGKAAPDGSARGAAGLVTMLTEFAI